MSAHTPAPAPFPASSMGGTSPAVTKSVCCYCGVGCGVMIESQGGRITGVRGDPTHPANFGRLCAKGSALHLAANAPGRLLQPELRLRRDARAAPVSWHEALDHAAARFAATIRDHGPDSVAFYISGQLLTEDYYVFNKLVKGLIGTNNIDTNSRLCMSSAVSGYKSAFGVDAPPTCYEDLELARCLFIAGANPAFAHPVLYRRIEEARERNPALKLVVVDPRHTDTAAGADLHLPILPGTDVALFHAMLHVMLWDGLVDTAFIAAHTEGFDALKERVREFTPVTAAAICGVPAADIATAARWFAAHGPTLSLYCQGLNQSAHGTDNNIALINLHLATGQLGKPGAGPFSLTGQPNAMGGREVGGMATMLSAHRELDNAAERAELAQLWGVPALDSTPGKTAVELFAAIARGEIKAVWIACTNPAQSMPNNTAVGAALAKADFVVVQEAYRDTDTLAYGDLLLPAACWGEKTGTVTNSERRISLQQQAVMPPGEARADWEIATDFARRLAQQLGNTDGPRLFPYRTPEQIFDEHRETTRGRDLDITGLSYALLSERGPQQWPFPAAAATGTARLYVDGVFPTTSGRARFGAPNFIATAEDIAPRYPLRLLTGRLRDHWHGMSRTGGVARLCNHVEEPLLTMHETDMLRRGLAAGELVRVSSRRGSLILRVEAAASVRPGQVFMPMHWGAQFMHGGGANALTIDACDPISKQPEFKHCAVQVEKFSPDWELVAMRTGDAAILSAVRPLLRAFAYASCGLHGFDTSVVMFRAAGTGVPDRAALSQLDSVFGLADEACALRYDDARRGIAKHIVLEAGTVVACRLLGDVAARGWLQEAIARAAPLSDFGAWLLAPNASSPVQQAPRGRTVCTCLNVGEAEIMRLLDTGVALKTVQERLGCGTACGSCLPELRRMRGVAA